MSKIISNYIELHFYIRKRSNNVIRFQLGTFKLQSYLRWLYNVYYIVRAIISIII